MNLRDKKTFLKWFDRNKSPKLREGKWILAYLQNHPDLLNKTHFINREVESCPKGMMISSSCSDGDPFLYFNNNTIIKDAEETFRDIRSGSTEELFVQINFRGWDQTIEYINVLEDNPYSEQHKLYKELDEKFAEEFLAYTLEERNKHKLMLLIDRALDEKNEKKFLELTKKLKV